MCGAARSFWSHPKATKKLWRRWNCGAGQVYDNSEPALEATDAASSSSSSSAEATLSADAAERVAAAQEARMRRQNTIPYLSALVESPPQTDTATEEDEAPEQLPSYAAGETEVWYEVPDDTEEEAEEQQGTVAQAEVKRVPRHMSQRRWAALGPKPCLYPGPTFASTTVRLFYCGVEKQHFITHPQVQTWPG